MLDNKSTAIVFCNLKHTSLYFFQNNIKITSNCQSKPCFLKNDAPWKGSSVRFKTTLSCEYVPDFYKIIYAKCTVIENIENAQSSAI